MSDFWQPKGGSKLETWGAFLEYSSEFGVKVGTDTDFKNPDGSKGTLQYLYRHDGATVLTYPMPMDCPNDRRLGYPRVLVACERLKIPMPKWPIAF